MPWYSALNFWLLYWLLMFLFSMGLAVFDALSQKFSHSDKPKIYRVLRKAGGEGTFEEIGSQIIGGEIERAKAKKPVGRRGRCPGKS